MTTILNPRCKIKLIEFYFRQIYRANSYKDYIDKIHKICVDLVNQYQWNGVRQEPSNLSFSNYMVSATGNIDSLCSMTCKSQVEVH